VTTHSADCDHFIGEPSDAGSIGLLTIIIPHFYPSGGIDGKGSIIHAKI
jgi:hypothetical protein